jgi:two-component system response regulator NreC
MKLVILDPSEIFRIGLRVVLARHRADLELVSEESLADAEMIATLDPDLVLADLQIPPADAIGLIGRLRELGSRARVAVMSRHAPKALVRQLLRAGACGFLLTTTRAPELVSEIDRILNGDTVVPPSRPSRRPALPAGPPEKSDLARLNALSRRERQVFDLIVWGCANKEIADYLSISVKTVETHRGHINGKLGARCSADIVRVAAFAGALDGAGVARAHPRAL